MGLGAVGDSESRFAAYVEGLASVIGHAARQEPLRDYCVGLVMPGERKSVEPMAAVTAPSRVAAQHQSLLHFVGNAPWYMAQCHFPLHEGCRHWDCAYVSRIQEIFRSAGRLKGS